MGYRKEVCSLGHEHVFDICDLCGRDLNRAEGLTYTLTLGRAGARKTWEFCIDCAAKSEAARMFCEIPGFNHDEIHDALGDPRRPATPPGLILRPSGALDHVSSRGDDEGSAKGP